MSATTLEPPIQATGPTVAEEALGGYLAEEGRGRPATPLAARLTLTDMRSPGPETVAGQELAQNLLRLAGLGGSGAHPAQRVSLFEIPSALLETHTVFLAGSPANHDPDNERFPSGPCLDNVSFKEAGFYSMCYATPPHSAVMMTYSRAACGRRLEFWTLPDETPGRALLVLPAWFSRYRPRLGRKDTLEPLADDPDTSVAIYAPPSFLADLVLREGQLDVAATVARWLGPERRLLTFGAYTAELEVDIASAA